MGEGGGIALYHPVVVSESVSDPAHNIPPTKSMLGPNSLYTSPREEREEQGRDRLLHTPSIAFRHLPPNSARFSYATVQRRGQRPPKGSGTDKTVEAT